MSVVKRFLIETGSLSIRDRMEAVLADSSEQSVEQHAMFVKALLGLAKELSLDRDCRMGFDEQCKC